MLTEQNERAIQDHASLIKCWCGSCCAPTAGPEELYVPSLEQKDYLTLREVPFLDRPQVALRTWGDAFKVKLARKRNVFDLRVQPYCLAIMCNISLSFAC